MKAFSTDLLNLLAAGVPCSLTTLFAIGPCRNGAYIYACDGQLPVSFGGNVYQPSTFGSWSRGGVTTKIGLESNSCDLTLLTDNQVPVYFPGTSNTALMTDGIKFGLLGNANVTIYTLYNSDFLPGCKFPATTGPTAGSLVETKFVGMVTAIPKIGMTKTAITVQDMLYLLNIQVPRRVFQASCSNTLFDAGCTLAAASFTRTGAVGALTYPYQFTSSAHIAPVSSAGTFTQGVLIWTSGKNVGLTSFVRAWTAGGSSDTIQLDVAPIFAIQVGDAFQIREGCNKTVTSCANLQGSTNAMMNFGGQPNVPVPETAIGG